jgi:hypothetical protein
LTNPQTQNSYIYSHNNPVNLSDPSGKAVYGACANAAFGAFLYGSCSVCVLYSPKEGLAPSATISWGGIAVATAGIAAQYSYSNANTFKEVEGFDRGGGAGVDAGIGWGIEYMEDSQNSNIKSVNTGPQIGIDYTFPIIPAEVHAGTGNTWVLY